MLYRKAYQQLLDWKEQPIKKALCVTGARQVGKTTLIRHFAQEQYENFAELNFLTDPPAKAIFDGSLQPDVLVANLTAYLRRELVPGKTLVLLDEIQECPQARTAIKFLVEDGRFDYIESGSLLGVRTKEVSSLPVGFETPLQMFPMDFEEFCLANGVQQTIIDHLQTCFAEQTPVSQSIHDTMKRLFYSYIVVGGMPEAVNLFVTTHDIGKVIQFQREILELYRQDITKYADREKAKIRNIFDAIPSQLEDKNRRFILADLRKTARQQRYESSFLWLNDAGVALPCYNVTQPAVPLKLNEKHSLFKLFLCDTGLLCAASMENIQFPLLQGDLSVNLGSVLENMIAQQLHGNGFPLYYFNSVKQGEVDFLVQSDHTALPIKVKSGKDYTAHRALDHVMAVREWNIPQAYVLCQGNVQKVGKILYLPWYMVMFIKPTAAPQQWIAPVDLSGLTLNS